MRLFIPLLVLCFAACSPPVPSENPEPTPLSPDASTPEIADSGVQSPPDSGSVAVDAGLELDAGVFDAGMIVVDAGMPVIDAGVPCTCLATEVCVAGRCVPDTNAPRITVMASAGQTAATLHVTGTATDAESQVVSVELRINNGTPVTVSVQSGAYEAQVTVPSGRAEFTVVATGRDAANNTATAQTLYDAAAPVITLTPAQSGACSATGCTGAVIDATATSFQLTADVTEGLALAATHPVQVRVLNGSTELVTWSDLSRQPDGRWTWAWMNLPALDFTQLTLEVAATDAAGNRGTSSLSVLLDRVRPTLTLSPSQNASCTASACTGTIINATSAALNLMGLVSADATIALRVLDGAAEVVPATAVPQTSGSWSWTWSAPPLVDGRFYAVEVTATDALRNSVSRQLVVLVDRLAPSLLVNSPRQGTLVGSAQLTVNASSADGLGLMLVEASADAVTFSPSSRDANGDFVVQLPVPIVDAVEQTLTVRATDLAGNVRVTTTRYTADRVAPRLTLVGTDFDCSGNACTGNVANAATTSVLFSGAITDASAVTIAKSLVGPSGFVVNATDPAVGASWAWTWSNLPTGINGAAYELHVTATDAAGNVSVERIRRTWLDNVAPTVTVPVATQRGVAPTATLLVFSEPMNATSVQSAAVLSPLAALTSTDGARFTGVSLRNYTPYTLTLAAAADKAGNASAPTTATFLTAPYAFQFAVPYPAVAQPIVGTQFRSPRIAVDGDGRFVLAWTQVNSVTAGQLLIDTGTGSFSQMVDPTQSPTFVRVTDGARGIDQRLPVTLDLQSLASPGNLFTTTRVSSYAGGDESFANTAWNLVGGSQNTTLLRPVLDFVPFANLSSSGTAPVTVAPNVGATAMLSWDKGSGAWVSSSIATLAGFVAMDGSASIEAPSFGVTRVRYWDFGQMSEVFASSSAALIRSATGQPALKTLNRFRQVISASSSYAAWTTDSQFSLACSAAPFGTPSNWFSSSVALPGVFSGSLASAMSGSKFVVAATSGSDVVVYSTPLTGCSAAPVLTREATISGAKDPGVTIDSLGRIWVVTVSLSGGLNVSRF